MATATKYIEAIGRRKTATARVRIFEGGKNQVEVNEKPLAEYFKTPELQHAVLEVFSKTELPTQFNVTARVMGGGVSAQAEAVRHGIARALVLHTAELRKDIKKQGFLKRDPRMVERKKFGLKKARKAAQWSKR